MTARKRAKEAPPRWRLALVTAETPAERLAVAHDRLRAGLKWLGRPQPDLASRQRDRDMAATFAMDAAEYLNAKCDEIDERRKKAVSRRERKTA
jgi:hypothetical protein